MWYVYVCMYGACVSYYVYCIGIGRMCNVYCVYMFQIFSIFSPLPRLSPTLTSTSSLVIDKIKMRK